MNTSSFRLIASIEGLREGILAHENVASTENKRRICLEVCELFFRFADVADRIPDSDQKITSQCVSLLTEAEKSLGSAEGDEEVSYLKSVQDKSTMVKLIVDDNKPIDEVLLGALAKL